MVDGSARQADGGCHLLALLGSDANQRVDHLGDDLLGSGVSHFFDVHAAFARSDQGHLLRGAVGHQGHVQFVLDVGAVFDVQAANLLAFGARLVRDQLHAQDLFSQLLDVVDGLGNLHAAALATATCVDLGLDHPHGAAELLCSFHGFLHRESGNAARNGHTKLTQDFLALVFVNLHEVSLREGW